MSIFFRPYLLTDGRSLERLIVFSGRPGYHFIYDECVLEEIRQDWASFVFGVWFLCVRRGSILIEGGCFWSGNSGFRMEVGWFLGEEGGSGILNNRPEIFIKING